MRRATRLFAAETGGRIVEDPCESIKDTRDLIRQTMSQINESLADLVIL